MLGDPVLWQAFYQAKDALISALREAPLVYEAPFGLCAGRDTGSVATSTLLQCITETVDEVETVQSELSSLRSHLIRSRTIITNQCSLPGMLPIELLQNIISLVISHPRNCRTTLRLSHVSKRFRYAVLDMSRLFTEANWTRWPVTLLELWCQRARTNPLKIFLSDTVLHSVGEARKRALLESCSFQWGYLRIYICSPWVDESVATGICNLLRCSAPSLHTFVLRDQRPHPRSTSTQFALDCAPTFHTLYLCGMWPLLPASHTSVTDLTCKCRTSRDWLCCQDVIRSCRLLQRLKLKFGSDYVYVDMATDPNMRATLTSVVHLELWRVGERNVAAICQLLAHFDMPNLGSLSINPHDRKVEAHADLYESLVRGSISHSLSWLKMPSQGHKFPGISTLLVHKRAKCPGNTEATLQVLNSLRRRQMIFPHLSELHLLDYHLTMEVAQAIQDVLLLRKDALTHLTTRMPKDAAVLQFLRNHVQNLKVCYPFAIHSL
jgi:hypothetical protein